MNVHLELTLATAVSPSPHVLQVAAMFGLGLDQERSLQIVPPIDLELAGGQVVFVTGPSGSGKSSILNLIAGQLANRPDATVLRFDRMPDPPDRPLVDCFPGLDLARVTALLSLAGLNDAFVMLRRPAELSDGQRYRLRLAMATAAVEGQVEEERTPLAVVLADEFGATLDRVSAAVIARNVRKWTRRRRRVCFIAATTHDDLLEALEPDVLIEKPLGQGVTVLRRAANSGVDA